MLKLCSKLLSAIIIKLFVSVYASGWELKKGVRLTVTEKFFTWFLVTIGKG